MTTNTFDDVLNSAIYPCEYLNNGYKLLYASAHPASGRDGTIFEHRWVMEQKLGRFLERAEIVHHLDDNRLNNEIDNLVVMLQSEHVRLHSQRRGVAVVIMRCPRCDMHFLILQTVFNHEQKRAGSGKLFFCGRRCSSHARDFKGETTSFVVVQLRITQEEFLLWKSQAVLPQIEAAL